MIHATEASQRSRRSGKEKISLKSSLRKPSVRRCSRFRKNSIRRKYPSVAKRVSSRNLEALENV